MPPSTSSSLVEALLRFDITLPTDQVSMIDRYRKLLWDWNTKINLTRHTDFDTFVGRDVVDSLKLSQLLASNEEVLDVGSGGGVPGILLAILRPDAEVTLCDSVRKKTEAIKSIVTQLELPTPIHRCRAESLLDDFRFDSIVARAVGPLWKICSWFDPHWASIGRLLLIKGPKWVEERAEARARGLMQHLDLRRAAVYTMAGTHTESVILQLTRRKS